MRQKFILNANDDENMQTFSILEHLLINVNVVGIGTARNFQNVKRKKRSVHRALTLADLIKCEI